MGESVPRVIMYAYLRIIAILGRWLLIMLSLLTPWLNLRSQF